VWGFDGYPQLKARRGFAAGVPIGVFSGAYVHFLMSLKGGGWIGAEWLLDDSAGVAMMLDCGTCVNRRARQSCEGALDETDCAKTRKLRLIVDTVRGIKNRHNLAEDECTQLCQPCPSTVDLRRRQGRTRLDR